MGSDHSISHSLLLEREDEIGLIATRARAAADGAGGIVILEGPAGIGKTRLMAAALDRGEDWGLRVLRARAGEFERAFPHAVVRQLFEAAVAENDGVALAGAAALAGPVFDPGRGPAGVDASYGVLHGLFWLASNLAERRPLMLAVDDVQWCDAASLQFLTYLGRRVEGLRVLVVATNRIGEPGADDPLVAELHAFPGAAVRRLEPLSPEAVAALAEAMLGTVDTGLTGALHHASGGNPLLVREILRAAGTSGVEAGAARTERILGLASAPVLELVQARLRRLGAGTLEVARAAALLGDGADPRAVIELAAVGPDDADAALRALARTEVLASRAPVRFAHPIVRAAVYSDIGPGARGELHARAAALLAASGRPHEEVATHLLAVAPAGNPAVVETLRRAARRAADTGGPGEAAAYLRRALAEPPLEGERPGVLLDLGRAETRSDPEAAVTHLAEALAGTTGPEPIADTGAELAATLVALGRIDEALAALDAAADRCGASPDAALRLRAEAIAVARFEPAMYADARHRLAALGEVRGDGPGARAVLALLASESARAGTDPDTAGDLAAAAVAGEGGRSWLPFNAAQVFVHLDRFDVAERIYAAAMARARTSGSAFQFALVSGFRAGVGLRRGRLADAEAEARGAVDVVLDQGLGGWVRGWTVAYLAEIQADRGALDEASTTLDLAGIGEDVPGTYQLIWFRATRGRVRAEHGQLVDGLRDLHAAGAALSELGVRNPAQLAWRSQAALVHRRLGDDDEARRLVDDEVELARGWGAPRALGIALRAQGVVHGGERGIEHLREAIAVLDGSEARLELARALTDLGAALRRANRRTDAREPLARGRQLAHACGAEAFAALAHAELVATGARPRRIARIGVDALTPSERRVADLAAAGQSNAEIAQALFVTTRAIESHLSSTYRKLGIESRSQLGAALTAAAP